MRLGPGLEVPLQVLGSRLAIVADPGAGKTLTAKALVERAHDLGLAFAGGPDGQVVGPALGRGR